MARADLMATVSTPRQAPQRWGVVGGGMLGLTVALRLVERGHDVTVFEGAGELGGLASAWRVGDVTWDRHYHVTLGSDTELLGLLAELGLDGDLEWGRTYTGCYADGALHSVSNALELLRFPPLSMIDKLRLGLTLLYGSRVTNWRRLEAQSVERWLTFWSGARAFRRFWLPLLRAKLGENYRIASAAFLWATIRRLTAARDAGMAEERFGYVSGGYARIIARYGEVLRERGVKFELGARVTGVAATPGGGVGVRLPMDVEHRFDRVAVTTASPVAARLIEGLAPDERRRHEQITYQGIVCASVLLRRPLARYYITNITDDTVPFTAVIEMSTLVDARRHLGGHALVYLPRYTTPSDPITRASDDQVRSDFVAALQRMYPSSFSPDDVLAFRVSRVRYVFPVPTVGYSRTVPPVATSVPGVYALSSAHIVNGTLNVNETVQLANRAVSELTR